MAAILLVVLSACGSSGGEEAEVRPFSEVQDGAITFEADPSDPSRGIFRVTTTEPMICAIVWGEDESFGRFNNSLAMNGTGIVQHDVVLPEVDAGREYTFVVQGTTADGTLYRSEVSTFTIDAAPDVVTSAPQVPVGADLTVDATIVDASSSFSDDFGPALAIDGDDRTEWSTAGDGDDGFITVDLGAEQEIGAVEFVTRSMADGSAVTDTYTVTVDGAAAVGPFTAGTPAAPSVERLVATGRELRFDIDSSTGGNVGAIEIRVYARA